MIIAIVIVSCLCYPYSHSVQCSLKIPVVSLLRINPVSQKPRSAGTEDTILALRRVQRYTRHIS